MKKDIKLYNMIFPVWLMVLIPWILLPAAALNFGIDTLVVMLTLKHLGIAPKKTVWKKSIIRVVIFGFLGDIAGALAMVGTSLLLDEAIATRKAHDISSAMMYCPWKEPIAVILCILWMALASFIIYKLDKRFAFSKTELDHEQKKKLALSLAVFTTPILFLVPTTLFV